MPDNNIFSGIPSLDDAAGLEQYVNNTTLSDMGLGNPAVPPALQQTVPQQDPQPAPAQEPAAPAPAQYTAEQVADIVARAQAQMQQQQHPQSQPQGISTPTYTAKQAAIIHQLIDRGVPMERIQAALNGNRQQAAAQNAFVQRLQNVEAYLQNQQYLAEQNAFIDKMTSFGDKFGLSENDLVTFGNAAMAMGINLTTVNDVEAVFRAVYPEQYAIRSQRIAGAPVSQIYGGTNTPEAPRASASKLEDAYVDNFLKQAMPNQYGNYPSKH
jgi:hypothetical protein